MKSWLMAAAALATLPVFAGNPWITLNDGTEEAVIELGPQAVITVLEYHSTAVYGESPTQIAIVSYDLAAVQHQLRIFDKHTRQVVATWAVPVTPVRQLSGAAPDVVLIDDLAFLLTHSFDLTPAATPTRNERGGYFNVMRIALRTGEHDVLPLGEGFANPRLSNFGGIPLVTDWAGYSVARLSADGKEMVSAISRDKLFSQLPDERAERERRTLPFAARADYVAVPGAGVFRMSKFGVLHRVADARLAALAPPFASIPLGPAQLNERLLAATSAKGPAIAVVRREEDKRTLVFIDARTLTESWRRELPPGVSPSSLIASDPDAVLAIDAQVGALVRLMRERVETLRTLPASPHQRSARILSAGNP